MVDDDRSRFRMVQVLSSVHLVSSVSLLRTPPLTTVDVVFSTYSFDSFRFLNPFPPCVHVQFHKAVILQILQHVFLPKQGFILSFEGTVADLICRIFCALPNPLKEQNMPLRARTS